MKIGVSTAAYYGRLETDAAAAHLASLGIEHCEVFLQSPREYSPSFGALVRERLGTARTLSIHAKSYHMDTDLTAASVHQREDGFAMFEGFLRAGQALGAEVCVFHGAPRVRGGNNDFARWQEGIDRAIALARRYGIDFCWETVSWCHLNSPDLVPAFRRLWPDLKFVLDIKQVYELRHRPEDYIDAMDGALRHIHLLDHDENGKYTLPGLGRFDFAALGRALRAARYTGHAVIEPYLSSIPSDRALVGSVHWLEDIL